MFYGQISFEELLQEDAAKEEKELPNIRSVGDTVGRVVLGELRTAVVTKVEGLPYYPFYRTGKSFTLLTSRLIHKFRR